MKIRIRLMMNADGEWAAYGWNGASEGDETEVLYDMLSSYDTSNVRTYDLTAEIAAHGVEEIPSIVVKVE